jgi:hypothetical protein
MRTYDIRGDWEWADTLEIVGRCEDSVWLHCGACGAWFWAVYETGGFAYRNEWRLPTGAAERALRGHEPGPIVELLVGEGLPKGPRWESVETRVQLLRHMTSGHDDAERIAALRSQPHLGSEWEQVLARLLDEHGAARASTTAGELEFIVDLRRDMAGCEEVLELPGAVIVPLPERERVLRFNQQGGVEIPLPGRPRLLARQGDGLLFALEGSTPSLRLFRSDTMLSLPLLADVGMVALPLDRGHYLLIPDPPPISGTPRVEVRDAKLEFVASLPVILDERSALPSPPRAMAEGWLACDVVDDAGERIGLCLFDEHWQVMARSHGHVGGRRCEVVDDVRVLAVPLGEPRRLEGWQREGFRLERIFELSCDAHVRVGDRLVCADAGELIGRDLAGEPSWRSRWGIGPVELELRVLGRGCVLVHGDRRLASIDPYTGKAIAQAEGIEGRVIVDRPGWAHAMSGTTLLSCSPSGTIEHTPLQTPHELVAAAGIGVVVRSLEDRSRHRWIACNGEPIAEFEAADARWSTLGSVAGPHVLERERLRIHRLPAG